MKLAQKIDLLKLKSTTVSNSVSVLLKSSTVTEAVYIINEYIRSDPELRSILGDFNIFPLVAEGPRDTDKSYPYIRYISVPVVAPLWQLQADFVRYYIGDKDYLRLAKITQRLRELLTIDDSTNPIPMKKGRFRIQSIDFLGGSNPTGPDQEEGMIERNLSITIIYNID